VVTALTIAGSDSSGGAGIQADLRTFTAMGVWGATAITAVTAQSSRGVKETVVIPVGMVRRQIDSALEDGPVAATKTGMLATAEIVEEVASAVSEGRLGPLVLDPVMISTSGHRLLEEAAVETMARRLLPLCRLLTPNIPEAEHFLGARIASRQEMNDAARRLADLGPLAVLLKGGHLGGTESPDFLWQDGEGMWLEGERVTHGTFHGSGCILSAAITAGLAQSEDLVSACRQGKDFVAEAIRATRPSSRGS
jgi:hydroxymethylpyrimidine/phosphomethylpyrimidine kinase